MDKFQIETAQNISIHQNVAHITTRIGAFLIDGLIMIGYLFLVIFILSWLNIDNGMKTWVLYLLISLPIFFYSLLFETLNNGQTPGKYFTKIRVVKLDGSKPTFGSYLMRWVLRVIDISLASGSVAVLTILLNGKGQRLGDIAAGTTVISEKKRITLQDTIATDVPENYIPTYPQVTLLSDADVSTIKKIYTTAVRNKNHKVIVKLHQKIIEITEIKTTENPLQFVDRVLKDYSFYTRA